MKFVKTIPMAIPGLALALAALGNLLAPAFAHGQIIRYICGGAGLIVLVIFVTKLLFDWPHAREELKTPIPLSALPTATMATMLLAGYLRPYLPNISISIWWAALATQIGIMLIFAIRFLLKFSINTVFPTWFITGVGIVTASVTAPAMGFVAVGQAAFWAGFGLYFVLLFLIIFRMNRVRIFPEPARKTIAIFMAPPGLLIAGYFQSFVAQGYVTPGIVYLLLIAASISYIYVILMIILEIRKIDFYPTYAAMTFPFVIAATAARAGANFLATRHGAYFLTYIANGAMYLAIAAVVFVLIHYVKYFRFWMKY
ncbi:MAG: TDT family transporter [Defluviitaleaceae bacterium]|nr:TDT family transporter [Defluviitaleaceae bacterium]